MCNKCGTKPRVQYKNSHATWCRDCTNEYQKEWKKGKPKYIYPTGGPIVYAYFDGLKCVYVGRGTLIRAKAHKYISEWWSKTLLLLTMTCENEWEAMEYEGKWGGRYLPEMNKDGYRHQ